MRGYRFYLEHNTPIDKRKGNHQGNVFAAQLTKEYGSWRLDYYRSGRDGYHVEGAGAVYFEPNSDVCGMSASLDYLRENCKRISEAKAREIHPNLFTYLDRRN